MRLFFLTAAVLVTAVGSAPANVKHVVSRPFGSTASPSLPPPPLNRGARAPVEPNGGPERLPLYDGRAKAVRSRPARGSLPSPRFDTTQQSDLGQTSRRGRTAGVLSDTDLDLSPSNLGRLWEEANEARVKARKKINRAKHEEKKKYLGLEKHQKLPSWAVRFELDKLKEYEAEIKKYGLPTATVSMNSGGNRHHRKLEVFGMSSHMTIPKDYRGIPLEFAEILKEASRNGQSSYPQPKNVITEQFKAESRKRRSARDMEIRAMKRRLGLSGRDHLPKLFRGKSIEEFERMLPLVERKARRSRVRATAPVTSGNQEGGAGGSSTNTRTQGRDVTHPLTPLAIRTGASQAPGRTETQGEGGVRKVLTERNAAGETLAANKSAGKRTFLSLASLPASQSQSPGLAKKRKITVEQKADGIATPEGQASRAERPLNPPPFGRERIRQSMVAPTSAPVERKADGVLGEGEGSQQRVQGYGATKSKPRRYMRVMSDSESE